MNEGDDREERGKLPPAFFVPETAPESQEARYAQFAQLCRQSVPASDERIYSITYIHNGEEWTATVGEQLCGLRCWTTRSRGKYINHRRELSDAATVLAIFAGNPFLVVTNKGIRPDIISAWKNPFFAGEPKSVVYFSV